MSKEFVVRCTSLDEALAVCKKVSYYISDNACALRFGEIYPKYGHLDFVFIGLEAKRWGDYDDLIADGLTKRGLLIIPGWDFIGEPQEVFRNDISLDDLLAGGVL